MAGCRKPGRPSLEHRSVCVATVLWVAAWFSLVFFTCEMGSQRMASSQSYKLLVFFLNKVLLEHSMFIAFCYHRNCMAYGTWNMASPSLEKSLPIPHLWGYCTDWKWCDTVLGPWQLFSLHHYSNRQKVKVMRTRKKKKKGFNCWILQINESLTILKEPLTLRVPFRRWPRTSAWAPLYGITTQD